MKPRDVEDALVDAIDLRDVIKQFADDNPGLLIDCSPSPKPDPAHPGMGFLSRPATVAVLEVGGRIMLGDWDCSSCGSSFYMELALDRNGAIVDSLGGLVCADDVYLCDDCSPL